MPLKSHTSALNIKASLENCISDKTMNGNLKLTRTVSVKFTIMDFTNTYIITRQILILSGHSAVCLKNVVEVLIILLPLYTVYHYTK